MLFTIALTIWGSLSLKNLPIDAVPDITNNQVQVITSSPSLAAPEVERLITFPIEQATSNIPGIVEMRSFSRFGLSLVTIVFNESTDVYWARQQISERLALVRSQIPTDAGIPELAPVTTGLGEIFQYVVRPKPGYETRYDVRELRTIQDWIVRRQLLGTPGVADVSSFGGELKQYVVAIDPDKLNSQHLTISDVFNALEKNNQNAGGAYIEKGPTVLFIRTEGLAATIDDINDIVVSSTSAGMPILISDVANVELGSATRYGALVYNDAQEVAGGIVMMLKGENSSRVIQDVKAKIEKIQQSLDEGLVIEPFLDRTKMVNNAIGTVKRNLIEGALIVVFILVLFLGNLRAGLIVASVIPLSMLFAIAMMNLFGVSGNLMSLGALDFGLIVDGAVIIVEAVMHRLYHSRLREQVFSAKQMDDAVTESASKMMGAAVFGQVIILIVYLPILSLVGIEGKMFRPMAQTVSFALLGAFILSLTYVPMITSLVLSRKIRQQRNWSDRTMEKLGLAYRSSLIKIMRYPGTIVITAFLLFSLSVAILINLGGEFIPELEEGDFAVDTRVLTGSSLNTTIDATKKTAGLLLDSFPEVEKVVTKIGSGEIPTDPMPIEAADMMVVLKAKKEWTSAKSFDELAGKMSRVLEQVPGVTTGFQFPVQMRFNELMTGSRQDVVCKIFGEDLDSLASYAQNLGRLIQGVDGATDVYIETVTGLPQIVIKIDRSALARFGLNVEQVNRTITAAFAGAPTGKIYENERRFDLVVKLKPGLRENVQDINNLLIATPAGMQIPLSQVADVSVREGPNQIQREDAKRRIIVGFNVRGRDVETIVEELQQKVKDRLRLAPGYYVSYGGQFENLVEARERLSIAVPAALALIFLMLYFAFGSIKHALLVFTAIPLSAIGGIFALLIRDMPFSISAGVGFIALFGVAVLNGIVLITEFNRLKKEQFGNMDQVIVEGTNRRLRPVLMTAAVASLGFLPMALSNGAGAEVQRPLASVVIGGLISATALTLYLLPVLYKWFNRIPKKLRQGQLPIIILLLFATCSVTNIQAQPGSIAYTLEEVLERARKQNLSIIAANMQVQYRQALIKSANELSPTTIEAEYGNVNSIFNDTRFVVSQAFDLPVVYRRKRALFRSQVNVDSIQTDLTRMEVEREVRRIYAQLIDIMEREKVLTELDTVFQQFAQKSALRLEAGEANKIELATANTQHANIRVQRQLLQSDLVDLQKRLATIVNEEMVILPIYDSSMLIQFALPDKSLLRQHPTYRLASAQLLEAEKQVQVEKSSLLPSFSLGYSNQSFRGWQSKDGINQRYYSGSDRFNVVQGTISVPLFTSAYKARISAARVRESMAEIQVEKAVQELNRNYEIAIDRVQRTMEIVSMFKSKTLNDARVVSEQANILFNKGEINFLEWTIVINQSLTIRLNQLDAVRQYNEAVIELIHLSPSNN